MSDLLDFARRHVEHLRALEHPDAPALADDAQAIVDELERREPARRGRPAATVEKMMRRVLADLLYLGEAAPLLGAGVAESDIVRAAAGDRTEADALAGELLNISERRVRDARKWDPSGIRADAVDVFDRLLQVRATARRKIAE